MRRRPGANPTDAFSETSCELSAQIPESRCNGSSVLVDPDKHRILTNTLANRPTNCHFSRKNPCCPVASTGDFVKRIATALPHLRRWAVMHPGIKRPGESHWWSRHLLPIPPVLVGPKTALRHPDQRDSVALPPGCARPDWQQTRQRRPRTPTSPSRFDAVRSTGPVADCDV